MLRRGSLRGSQASDTLDQFEIGDVVHYFGAEDGTFYGIVEEVSRTENKVYVAWNNGVVKQHDPEEVSLVLYVNDEMRRRLRDRCRRQRQVQNRSTDKADGYGWDDIFDRIDRPRWRRRSIPPDVCVCRQVTGARRVRGRLASLDGFGEDEESEPENVPPDFVGDPKIHGIDKPLGGGYTIMQELVKNLRKDALSQQRFAGARRGSKWVLTCDLSRTAIYHAKPGRVYTRSREEVESDFVYCPKCLRDGKKVKMELRPFTQSVRIYVCPACDWKISADKLV